MSKSALIWLVRLLQPHWRALLACRGSIHSLSFVTHNFMHANNLDPERLNACAFSVMTQLGPVSMCQHNARRDDYILAPIKLKNGHYWHPLNNSADPLTADISHLNPGSHGLKHSKGRTRQILLKTRRIQVST